MYKNTRLVFKDVDDRAADQKIEITSSSVAERIEKLPGTFESVRSWPRRCRLKCWGCHLQFDTIPLFMVKSLEPNKTSVTTYGVVCSRQCGQFWITTNILNINERQNMLMNFEAVLKKIVKPSLTRTAYVPYYETEPYGGHVPTYAFLTTLNKFRITEENLISYDS
jgi:hypothetical protein